MLTKFSIESEIILTFNMTLFYSNKMFWFLYCCFSLIFILYFGYVFISIFLKNLSSKH